ncbi:MAG: SGNH/GDSL hydrolase family protein [Lentilactobacillus diolivorans]
MKANFNHQIKLLLILTLSFFAVQFSQTITGNAAKVNPMYRIATTKSVSLRMKAVNYKTKTAFWNHPYRSNKASKKTHWLRNYSSRSLLATKQATLKNGLQYYYVKVARKPSVAGWIYAKNLTQMTMVSLGDSITKGWTGSSYATAPYPQQVGSQLMVKDTNLGENNGKVVGDTDLDLTQIVNQTDFSHYDIATIAYGVNDYFHSSLDDVKQVLDEQIKAIKAKYPSLQLFGILPLDCYVTSFGTDQETDAYNTTGYHDYTLGELCTAEAQVYAQNGVKYLDWRTEAPDIVPATIDNTIFGDNLLHPTQATYDKISTVISAFLEENVK